MGIVEEEADECGFWLEMLVDSGRVSEQVAAPIHREAGELLAITVQSIITARGKSR